MASAKKESFEQQGFAGFHTVPGRGSRGVRQRDEIRFMAGICHSELAPNDSIQLLIGKKLVDGEFSDTEDEMRLKNIHFFFQPTRTTEDFIVVGNTISSGDLLSRKTATDSRHVDAFAKCIFSESATFLKPTEESLSGSPCKRTFQNRFFISRGLTDEKDFAEYRPASDDRFMHFGAQRASSQLPDMTIESIKVRWRFRHGLIGL